jgi:hypothetical protein
MLASYFISCVSTYALIEWLLLTFTIIEDYKGSLCHLRAIQTVGIARMMDYKRTEPRA